MQPVPSTSIIYMYRLFNQCFQSDVLISNQKVSVPFCLWNVGVQRGAGQREKMCDVVKVSIGVVQGREQTHNILGNINMV